MLYDDICDILWYMMIYDDIWWYTWCFIVHAFLFSHPHIETGLSRASWQDAYYLLEIDPWGRRFYHRGGMRTGAAGDVAFSGGSGSTYSDRRVPQTWGISSYSFNLDRSNKYSLTGWLFGRFGLFFHSGNVIIPTDKLIFFRGVGLNHQPAIYGTFNYIWYIWCQLYIYILSSLTIYGIYHDIYIRNGNGNGIPCLF